MQLIDKSCRYFGPCLNLAQIALQYTPPPSRQLCLTQKQSLVTPLSTPQHADKREDFSHQHYMELKHFWKFKQIIWTIEYLYFYATPDTQKTFLQPLDPVYYTLCPKKATRADTVFLNRGPLKVLYDSKYNASHLPL